MDKEFEKDLLPEDESEQTEEIVNEQTEADEVESKENIDTATDTDVAEDSDETVSVEDGEATSDEIPEPPQSSNRGVIVALIIVVVMIAAFFLIYFLQPKPKSVLNGVWESEASSSSSGSQVYFVFEDDKAYYMTNGNQVDYSVKYISEDEVELTYKNDTYSQVLGIKPEFSNDGKTVEFVNTYMNETYGNDENNKNVIIKLNKSKKTAKDLGVERNRETTTASTAATEATTAQATTVPSYKEKMSDKVKKSLQGIWVADSKSSDGKSSTKIFVSFDGKNLKYGNSSSSLKGKAIYVDDNNVVFRFEDQDFYIAYGVKVSGDKITLTPKYQIMSGYKQEATDSDTAVVLEKSDKEPSEESTKASDNK